MFLFDFNVKKSVNILLFSYSNISVFSHDQVFQLAIYCNLKRIIKLEKIIIIKIDIKRKKVCKNY